ncbi:MAG TPA: biotin/lipoyl-binding protein [Stellaceae bacterium]|nr:biotin/lipoyl-binding protein [Stellaceae bacterium]
MIALGAVLAVASAVVVSRRRPLTDDASVRANIIGIAPHVSGPLTELPIVDNQLMHKGELLFVVDPRPYQAQLDQAEAELKLVDREIDAQRNQIASARQIQAQRSAEYSYANNYVHRLEPLLPREFVSPDRVEEARTRREAAAAAVRGSREDVARAINLLAEDGNLNARRQSAQARVSAARLNVEYCRVTAPCDGYVTNLNISVGEYALEGRPLLAFVDARNWYVIGNFRETFLRYVRPGMPAEIYVLDYPGRKLRGEVQGIGWAVQQRDGPGTGLLPPVEPTLNWVRLAQRFPVRVRIVDPPADVLLRVGQTAAVTILSAR